MKHVSRLICFAAGLATAGGALAAISAEEAKQLGTTLTVFGAEKAGNKEGTIPPYTGEGVKPPASYDPKEPGRRPDPFANEKPLFSITAQNAAQYADKLDGMQEMFKKYPNFRMDIYPSHRTMTYPKWVLDNTLKNATACKGVDNDLKLEGCYGGLPFPIPKTGAQVMWMKLTSFEAQAWQGNSQSWVVANDGSSAMSAADDVWQQSWYYDPSITTPASPKVTFWAARVDDTAPARKVGQKLVLIDPLDTLGVGRRAYQYVPGQRRVKLAPDLAYDTPAPTAGGVMTMDDARVFLGAIDRYDWKLLGKKEKYIMYNNFKMTDHTTCKTDVIQTKSFANPDCVRWELHRVWAVEGKLKAGFRHIYARRLFYWDEDAFGAGMAENYDGGGKLYRIGTAVTYPYWANEGAGMSFDNNIVYDLQTGNWVNNGTTANPGTGWYTMKPASALLYSPEALAGEGIR